MSNFTFFQEIILNLVRSVLPVFILIFGGQLILHRSVQHVELVRFVREKHYEAVLELYETFAGFMKLYRITNSSDTSLEDEKTRKHLFGEAACLEAKVDALILRILSEHAVSGEKLNEGRIKERVIENDLASLRHSVQIFRERIRNCEKLPFTYSEQQDYKHLKESYAHVSTFMLGNIYKALNPPHLSREISSRAILDVFDNRHGRHRSQVILQNDDDGCL